MPTVFSPENRDVNPIQGVSNTPNSVIPTGLSNVNINPVNISPYFEGERARQTSIRTDLAIQAQALSERKLVSQERQAGIELSLKLLDNVNGQVRRGAQSRNTRDQTKLLNSETGLDVESPAQAALHSTQLAESERVQLANQNLIENIDIENATPAEITRMAAEMNRNNSEFQNGISKNTDRSRYIRLNALNLKFNDAIAKSTSFDFVGAGDLQQRLDFHRGIPGNYSEAVLNSKEPSEAELQTALAPIDYAATLTRLDTKMAEVFKEVERKEFERVNPNAAPGDEAVFRVNTFGEQLSGTAALEAGRRVTDDAANQAYFKNIAAGTFAQSKVQNPLLTQEQHLQNEKDNYIRQQAGLYQADLESENAIKSTARDIAIKTATTAKPASTGSGSGSGGGASTVTERSFAGVNAVLGNRGYQFDNSQTGFANSVINAGGVSSATFKDLGNGTSEMTIPHKTASGKDIPDEGKGTLTSTISTIVKNVPKTPVGTTTNSTTSTTQSTGGNNLTTNSTNYTDLKVGDNASTIFPDGLDSLKRNSGFDTNNPLNIKGNINKVPVIKDLDSDSRGVGADGKPKKLQTRVYPTMQEGIDAGINLLDRYKNGKNATFKERLKTNGVKLEDATIADMYDVFSTTSTPEKVAQIAKNAGVSVDTPLKDIPSADLFTGVLSVENSKMFEEFKKTPPTVAPSTEFTDLGETGFQYRFAGDGKIRIKNGKGESELSIDDYNLDVQNGKIQGPRLDDTGKPFPVGEGTAINTGVKSKKKEEVPKKKEPRTLEAINKELEKVKEEDIDEDEFGRSTKTNTQTGAEIKKLEKEKRSLERKEIAKKGRELKVEKATTLLDSIESKGTKQFKFDGFAGTTGRARVKITLTKSAKDPNKFLVKEGVNEIGILTKEEIFKKYIK